MAIDLIRLVITFADEEEPLHHRFLLLRGGTLLLGNYTSHAGLFARYCVHARKPARELRRRVVGAGIMRRDGTVTSWASKFDLDVDTPESLRGHIQTAIDRSGYGIQ